MKLAMLRCRYSSSKFSLSASERNENHTSNINSNPTANQPGGQGHDHADDHRYAYRGVFLGDVACGISWWACHYRGGLRMEKSVCGVYALIDPVTDEIRYIGQSSNIKKRYFAHMRADTEYPVSRWVTKLKRANAKPELLVLELCESPVSKEKAWIDRAKLAGCNLLNLHEGGAYPSQSLSGTSEKIWAVHGLQSPYRMLMCHIMPMVKSSQRIKTWFANFSAERKNCKTEEQLLDFEIKAARICHEFGNKTLELKIERWLMSVYEKVNAKYSGKLVLVGA